VGRSAGTIALGSADETRISINDALTNFSVTGDFIDSALMLGLDLGIDANFDSASGLNNDTLTTGALTSALIGGDFLESDIVAGGDRGPDRFFGTDDDSAARGRGNIQSFVVNGIARGSSFNSESFLVSATGDVVSARINGAAVSTNTSIGNLGIRSLDVGSVAIQAEIVSSVVSGAFAFVTIAFNQAMDVSTLEAALTITEVRTSDELTFGDDYTIAYDDATNSLIIRIDADIVTADIGDPTLPGVYAFALAAAVLRASIERARLDGDGDGAVLPGDDFTARALVGDAGDRIAAQDDVIVSGGSVDLLTPFELDDLFQGQLDTAFTISGTIGDNQTLGQFTIDQDVDLFRVSLTAGQIISISGLQGATGAVLTIFKDDDDGSGGDMNSLAFEGLRALTSDVNGIRITGDSSFVVSETDSPPMTEGGGTRAGDYTDVALDPSDLDTFWFVVEWMRDGTNCVDADGDGLPDDVDGDGQPECECITDGEDYWTTRIVHAMLELIF